MTTFDEKFEAMFDADMAAAKPMAIAKPADIDEFDVRVAYLDGIARAFERHFPSLKTDAST